MNCNENRQGSLTPLATDDDNPTPRFSPNDDVDSPVASFGLPQENCHVAGKGRALNRDTCQYVSYHI